MAMEWGYWDEKADEEEWRAFHTMHQVSVMVDSKQHKLATIDFMAAWAVKWKGYQKESNEEDYKEAMAQAVIATKELNRRSKL